jgi:hypothetical protein
MKGRHIQLMKVIQMGDTFNSIIIRECLVNGTNFKLTFKLKVPPIPYIRFDSIRFELWYFI